MTFGDFIRLKRLQKKLTQVKLAQKASMRQCEVCFLERYNSPIPSNQKLLIIASEIEVHPDVLFVMAGRVPQKLHQWLFINPEKNGEKCLEFLKNL